MSAKIIFAPGASDYEKRLAVELSGIWGFEAEAVSFPAAACFGGGDIIVRAAGEGLPEGLVRRDGRLYAFVGGSQASVDRLCRELLAHGEAYLGTRASEREAEAPEGYQAASDHPLPVPPVDGRAWKGLESFFEIGDYFRDEDGDWMPDRVVTKLLIEGGLSDSQTIAACALAARIGAETLGYTYPLTTAQEGAFPVIRFASGGEAGISMAEGAKRDIVVTGDGQALEDFAAALCCSFPKLVPGYDWLRFVGDFLDGLALKNLDGQLSLLESLGEGAAEKCFFSPGVLERPELERRYPGVEFHSFQEQQMVHQERFSLPWEVDVCRRLLEDRVYPKIAPGDKLDIRIALSEDRDSRRALAREIEENLRWCRADIGQLDVLCAYKQGFSWIEEQVLPELERDPRRTAVVEIAFRPFTAPEGERWMDLPFRYLQELYPIDDIIAQRLGVSRDAVRFVEYGGSGDLTYLVTAFTASGEEIFRGQYKAACAQIPYLPGEADVQWVHPATGYVRVRINGRRVLDEIIPTDLERIWEVYQRRVLPYCRRYIGRRCHGAPTPSMQPFFSQLRLDISASEPDEPLPCRQDMISSLDALHEDLYFTGLEYFGRYGMSSCGARFDAPGLILPVIRKAEGPPSLTFTLYSQRRQAPALTGPDGGEIPFDASGSQAALRAVRACGGGMEAVVSVRSEANLAGYLRAYARLLEEGVLDAAERLAGFSRLTLELNGATVASAALQPGREKPEPLDIGEVDLMEDRLIGYEEYLSVIAQLKRVEGIEVYQAAESYQGRKIYAIELLPTGKGYRSRVKRINRNPSKLVVARHHANEVSSTNACFLLLRELLQDPKYRDLGSKLNVVLIPMENPDGAAIHYALQKDNPRWKLHVARYDSLGKEFAAEYFKDHTIHTEALAFTRVYRKWTPDVVVDNHGVPSHEWEQQFSGYTSPMFRDFWLPRALLYGYFWLIDHPGYEGNLQVNERMEDAVAESLKADPAIAALNRDWRDRFEKYAHQWAPRLFQAEYYKDMISYRVRFPYLPGRYVSVSYPWLTTVCFTSEVSDETAQGGYLALCARTHLLHDLATTDLLLTSRCAYRRSLAEEEGGLHKLCVRRRPLLL